jgi:hypothetical protein
MSSGATLEARLGWVDGGSRPWGCHRGKERWHAGGAEGGGQSCMVNGYGGAVETSVGGASIWP